MAIGKVCGVEIATGGGAAVRVGEPVLTIVMPSETVGSQTTTSDAVQKLFIYDVSTTTFDDKTTEINEDTAGDVPLMPAAIGEQDYSCWGYASPFDGINVNMATAGAGSYYGTPEYWDGAAWSGLTAIANSVNAGSSSIWNFTGWGQYLFVRPTDWATLDINGTTTYWIRFRQSRTTSESMTTRPLATRGYILTLS